MGKSQLQNWCVSQWLVCVSVVEQLQAEGGRGCERPLTDMLESQCQAG